MSESYDFELTSQPDYGFLRVQLKPGQTITVENAAMASMDSNVVMKSKMRGGLLSSLKRKFLTGESMIINDFTAEGGPGEINIAPGPPGDLFHYRLEGGNLMLQNQAFVACSPEVELNTSWGGFKGFFSGTGLFLIKAEGTGDLFFNAYGAILEVDVTGDYVVDTGYIVAFEDSLEYNVTFLKGLKTGLLGGEGLVANFRGRGKVWIQTRCTFPFTWWIDPFRPSGGGGGGLDFGD